ncbi:iron-sulfur cluster assembly scaffold protein [Bacilli bacterium]|nr:iron-sulfur cluster assembly scaffold protein [Bacilli bacterium]
MSSNELDIRREIIMDHYENPSAKVQDGTKFAQDYKRANNDSPSCIDNLTAYVKIKNNKIDDIRFSGVGCAVATSSTDIMANYLVGKDLKTAHKIITNYLNMLDGNKYDKKLLQDLFVFENLNKQLNRIKCGKVGIQAIEMAILKK